MYLTYKNHIGRIITTTPLKGHLPTKRFNLPIIDRRYGYDGNTEVSYLLITEDERIYISREEAKSLLKQWSLKDRMKLIFKE